MEQKKPVNMFKILEESMEQDIKDRVVARLTDKINVEQKTSAPTLSQDNLKDELKKELIQEYQQEIFENINKQILFSVNSMIEEVKKPLEEKINQPAVIDYGSIPGAAEEVEKPEKMFNDGILNKLSNKTSQ